ncbi:putative esterase/lipase [Escherichia coli]|nr:putative esterase/lipase [Escherichia coli]
MKLNIRAQTAQNQHNNSPIVLVHGLFGSLDNLGVLARDLVNDHNIIQVDMRNHGLSPRDPVMNYPAMAQDLVDTLDAQQIDKATFIAHSMGGKAVMALTALAPIASINWWRSISHRSTITYAVMMRFSRLSTRSVNRTHKLASKQQQ